MLSQEDNDLLNQVGPGTPLNRYFKHFWTPMMTSRHLEAGGAPMKVTILGENYVLFRGDDGQVGCMDEACPHRGISLSLGRNENNALTCIFHGWSFDAKGDCVASPTEPNPDFCKKVKTRSYPVREAGGAIWAYLAPGVPAAFPDFPFMHLPAEETYARRGLTYSNWSHNMEAILDIGHLSILHKSFASAAESLMLIQGQDHPNYRIETTEYGLRTFSTRPRPGGMEYVRVDEYVAANAQMVASAEDEVATMIIFVPADDGSTHFWVFLWGRKEQIGRGGGLTDGAYEDFDWQSRLVDRQAKNFGQDRAAMKAGHWSGAPSFAAEDLMVLESMPVIDRTKEQLCSSDIVIIRHRRDLLRHLHAIRDGSWTGRPDDSGVSYRSLRGMAMLVPTGSDISALVNEKRMARQEKLAGRSEIAAQ